MPKKQKVVLTEEVKLAHAAADPSSAVTDVNIETAPREQNFPLMDLPADAQYCVGQQLFNTFTAALAAALAASTGELAEQRSREVHTNDQRKRHRTVNMSEIFASIKTLAAVSSVCRGSFRDFFIIAVFRTIVNDAKVSTRDSLVQGITLQDKLLNVASCAEEIEQVLPYSAHPVLVCHLFDIIGLGPVHPRLGHDTSQQRGQTCRRRWKGIANDTTVS